MATTEEIKARRLFRHKGGKLYRIDEVGPLDSGIVRWGCKTDEAGRTVFGPPNEHGARFALPDHSKVCATQWQINEKWPLGRPYQASRELKIADLTAID
jgi:hypothetical protein